MNSDSREAQKPAVGLELKPETPVQFVKGIGPERARALQEEGIATVRELLLVLPRRYEDRSNLAPIKSLRPGVRSTGCGRIAAVTLKGATRVPIFEALREAHLDTFPWLFMGGACAGTTR